jgi:cytoskeleton protein RodZ
MAQDSTQSRSKISDATEIDTGQSLGGYLQRERVKQGYTLDDIAEQTRINLTTLQAIESNDRARMPAEVFSKGFIKIYAKFLGLDVQDAMERYDREMAQTDEDSIRNHDVFYNEKLAESSIFSPGKVFLFLLLLGLIILGSYLFFSSESPQPRRSTLVFPEDKPAAAPAQQKENAPAGQNTLQWPADNGAGAVIEPFTEPPPAAPAAADREANPRPPQSAATQPQPQPPLKPEPKPQPQFKPEPDPQPRPQPPAAAPLSAAPAAGSAPATGSPATP